MAAAVESQETGNDPPVLIAGQGNAAPACLRLLDVVMLALVLMLVVAASSLRIAPGPGGEFYLGPFFYVLAYRIGGLRAGLAVAVATMIPTYFWWGHVFSIGIAVTHLLFLHTIRKKIGSMGVATFIYQATIGLAATYTFWHCYYDMPSTVFTLVFVRKALNDMVLAAAADMALAVVIVQPWPFRLRWRPSSSFLALRQTAGSLCIGLYAITSLVTDVDAFRPALATMHRDVAQQVAIADMRGQQQDRSVLSRANLGIPEVVSLSVAFSHSRSVVANMTVARQLGCKVIDDSLRVSEPRDKLTFAYWLQACQLGSVEGASGPVYFLFPTRDLAEIAYLEIIQHPSMAVLLLIFAGIWQLFYNHIFRRSVRHWLDLVSRFGTPGLVIPKGIAVEEFLGSVEHFVAMNNAFSAVISERQQLADTISTLTKSLDLLRISDIVMNMDAGQLSYIERRAGRAPVPVERRLDEPSRISMFGEVYENDVSIEVRFEGDDPDWCFLLLAGKLSAPCRWSSGYLKRVYQSKRLQERFLQKARLIELGVMVSALGHELKQPLFTIALAASNGAHALSDEAGEASRKARQKFENIETQVERTRSIVNRILGYSTAAEGRAEPFDLVETLNTAMALIKPQLTEKGVRVQISDDTGRPVMMAVSRTSIEQIIVNALQNAIDAIGTRREAENLGFPGLVAIHCWFEGETLKLDITDNGCGLQESIVETVFESFVTTKPRGRGTGLGLFVCRQIMTELGGSVTIRQRSLPASGAILSVTFPAPAIELTHCREVRALVAPF